MGAVHGRGGKHRGVSQGDWGPEQMSPPASGNTAAPTWLNPERCVHKRLAASRWPRWARLGYEGHASFFPNRTDRWSLPAAHV